MTMRLGTTFRSRPDRLRYRLGQLPAIAECLCALLTERPPAAAEAISAPLPAAGAFLKETVALLAVHWALLEKYNSVILALLVKECKLLPAVQPHATRRPARGKAIGRGLRERGLEGWKLAIGAVLARGLPRSDRANPCSTGNSRFHSERVPCTQNSSKTDTSFPVKLRILRSTSKSHLASGPCAPRECCGRSRANPWSD